MIGYEIDKIMQMIPELQWLRFFKLNEFTPHASCFAADTLTDAELEEAEDRRSAMTAASCSLGERIGEELSLGEARFTLVAGENGMHFVVPVGDGKEWIIAFVVRGQPAIDPIIGYFEDRENLAHLVPLLGV
jgi:hypothetical protein